MTNNNTTRARVIAELALSVWATGDSPRQVAANSLFDDPIEAEFYERVAFEHEAEISRLAELAVEVLAREVHR